VDVVVLSGGEQVRDAVPAQRGAAEQSPRGSGGQWGGLVCEESVEVVLALVERVELVVEVAQPGAQLVLTLAQTIPLRGEQLDLSGDRRREPRCAVLGGGSSPRCRHGRTYTAGT